MDNVNIEFIDKDKFVKISLLIGNEILNIKSTINIWENIYDIMVNPKNYTDWCRVNIGINALHNGVLFSKAYIHFSGEPENMFILEAHSSKGIKLYGGEYGYEETINELINKMIVLYCKYNTKER